MSSRLKHANHCVYNIAYHIIWCPKYRRKILNGNVVNRLKEILISKANQINCSIENIEIMPDHVHIFIRANFTISVGTIVHYLKGYSSFILRKEFVYLKKLKKLWSRSYFCESIGHISEKTVKQYIDDQLIYYKK